MSQLVFKLDLPDLFKILGDDARLEIKNDLLVRFRNEHLKPIVDSETSKQMAAMIVNEVIREYTTEVKDGSGWNARVVKTFKPEFQTLIRSIVDGEFKSVIREECAKLTEIHKAELKQYRDDMMKSAKDYIKKALPDGVVTYAKEQAIQIIKARL